MTSGEQIYWAFRNVERGYYLGATSDGTVTCAAKMPQSRGELWHIHLLPARGATTFAFKSIARKRYARVLMNTLGGTQPKEQIQIDATTPWGSDTLFQLKYFDSGRYALLTSVGKYLTCDGNCIEWNSHKSLSNGIAKQQNGTNSSSASTPPADTLFTIEYHGGNIAFRDYQGRYLTGAGRAAILRTRANNVSRDELFEIEQAPIQVAIRANSNHKWVSIKQSELFGC